MPPANRRSGIVEGLPLPIDASGRAGASIATVGALPMVNAVVGE
jgi:hypothetical protein